jgi:hypothetical protein
MISYQYTVALSNATKCTSEQAQKPVCKLMQVQYPINSGSIKQSYSMFCGQILIENMVFIHEDAPTPVPEGPRTDETVSSFATALETETEPFVS